MISIGYLNDGNALGNVIHDFFSRAGEFEVLFETKSEADLPSLLKNHNVEYLILSQVTGESISLKIKKEFPLVKIILLGFSNQHTQLPYHEGYYYFFIPPEDVNGIKHLSRLLANNISIHSREVKTGNGLDPRKLLTRKEREVISKLRERNDRKVLSDELNRELDTINKHVTNSLRKTKCRKLEELFDWIDEYENKNHSNSFHVAAGT
jgi:DNA-binding NarL/FixJ family response regulator